MFLMFRRLAAGTTSTRLLPAHQTRGLRLQAFWTSRISIAAHRRHTDAMDKQAQSVTWLRDLAEVAGRANNRRCVRQKHAYSEHSARPRQTPTSPPAPRTSLAMESKNNRPATTSPILRIRCARDTPLR